MNEPWYKKLWIWITAAFALIIGLFAYEKKRADKLESEVESGKSALKEATLAERQKAADEKRQADEAELERLKKERQAASAPEMTPEEVKKYWENR